MDGHNNFDSLHGLMVGKHFYQFYKTSEDYLSVMIPYFQAGLEKNDACVWLVSERNGIELCRSTAEAMISQSTRAFSTGQFQILSAENWYLTNGTFDGAKAAQNAFDHAEKLTKMGYKRLRGAGDGGTIPREDWSSVVSYEREMGPWIKSQPIIALCAYPILECTPSQARSVLECHEGVLVGRF